MTRPTDAATIAALQRQHSQLTVILQRLQRARAHIVPAGSMFWAGLASSGYDSAMRAMALTVDAGIGAIASARDHTGQALIELAARA